MGFTLNDNYINDSYLRSQLLNNQGFSNVFEEFNNNGLDDDYTGMTDEKEDLFFKLNVYKRKLSMDDLLNFLDDLITNENIDLYSSLISMNSTHLLSVLYLLYEGRIVEEDIEKILSSSTFKGRTELILSYLNQSYEDNYIDIFLPLKDAIRDKMHFKNPTEKSYYEIKNIRKELKNKILNLKTQSLSYGNFFYADKSVDSPLYNCSYSDDSINYLNENLYSEILSMNIFNIKNFELDMSHLSNTAASLEPSEDDYKNYILKSGRGNLTFEEYKKDIKNGYYLREFIKSMKKTKKEEVEIKDEKIVKEFDIGYFKNFREATYSDSGEINEYEISDIRISLDNIFSKTLTDTILTLVNTDFENRNNTLFRNKYPTLNGTISSSLQNSYRKEFNYYLNIAYNEEENLNYETEKYSFLTEKLGDVDLEGSINKEFLSNFIKIESSVQRDTYVINNILKANPDYNKDFNNIRNVYPKSYIFNLKNENYIDSILKIDLLIDDDCNIINFGSVNILNIMNDIFRKIEDAFRNCYGEKPTMNILAGVKNSDLINFFNNEIINNAVNYTIPDMYKNSPSYEFLFNVSKKIIEDYLLNYLFDSLKKDIILSIDSENFNTYKQIFYIRHSILRFNDAILKIKNNPIYKKIMNDVCNCSKLFDDIASYIDYLNYNDYFQTRINSDNLLSVNQINKFKPFIDGFGGIL